MAYIIAAPCVADYSCVEVCPAHCISPKPAEEEFLNTEQLYIDPEKCIDCAACIDICPVNAIFQDSNVPEKWVHYVDVNRNYFLENNRKNSTKNST